MGLVVELLMLRGVALARPVTTHKVTGGGTVYRREGVSPTSSLLSNWMPVALLWVRLQHSDVGLRNHADVLYLSVSGGDAWIGAIITESNDPALVGQEIYFRVQDNDQGSTATGPDMVSSVVPGPAITTLSMPPLSMMPWTNGNVRVN